MSASYLRAGTGTPLVLLHGIGGSARIWQPQIDHFEARGYDVVAWNLPGCGGQPALDRTDFASLSAALEGLIAELGLNRPILAGHSLGGMVVQTFLRRNPHGARGAVLSGTSPAFGDPGGDFQQKFLAGMLGPLDEAGSMAAAAPELVGRMIATGADHEGVKLAVASMAGTPEATYRAMVAALPSFDERAGLSKIRIPVLCLAGGKDRNAPAPMMEKMAGRIPDADYVCLEGVGHLPNVEWPERFNAALADFFQARSL